MAANTPSTTSCLKYVGVLTPALKARLWRLTPEQRKWDIRERQEWAITITVDPFALGYDKDQSIKSAKLRRYKCLKHIWQRQFITSGVERAIYAVDCDMKRAFNERCCIRWIGLWFELTQASMVHAHGIFESEPRAENDKSHSIQIQTFHRELEINLGRTLIEHNPEGDWDAYCAKQEDELRGLAWAMPYSLSTQAVDAILYPSPPVTKCIRRKKLAEFKSIVLHTDAGDPEEVKNIEVKDGEINLNDDCAQAD